MVVEKILKFGKNWNVAELRVFERKEDVRVICCGGG